MCKLFNQLQLRTLLKILMFKNKTFVTTKIDMKDRDANITFELH